MNRTDIALRILMMCHPFLLLTLCACQGCAESPGATSHPIERSMVRPTETVRTIGRNSRATANDELTQIRDMLRALPDGRRIGVLEGPPELVFGAIADAAVDAMGNLFVLDSRFRELRLFDVDGAFLFRTGNEGAGPGEFRLPDTFAIDDQRRLYVADHTSKIQVFGLTNERIEYQSSFRMPPGLGRDLCVMSDTLYAHGVMFGDTLRSGDAIHSFSLSGEYLSSFGTVYEWKNPNIVDVLSAGRIVCAVGEQVVIHVSRTTPDIRAYSALGELLWVTRISDYIPQILEEYAGRIHTAVPEGEGCNYLHSLSYAKPGAVVVQISHVTLRSLADKKEYEGLDTYVLSSRTGEGVYVGVNVPAIAAVTPSQVIVASHEPFPHLTIHRLIGGSR